MKHHHSWLQEKHVELDDTAPNCRDDTQSLTGTVGKGGGRQGRSDSLPLALLRFSRADNATDGGCLRACTLCSSMGPLRQQPAAAIPAAGLLPVMRQQQQQQLCQLSVSVGLPEASLRGEEGLIQG